MSKKLTRKNVEPVCKEPYKEDDVNRYNHPYHEFYDGTTTPYGHVCDDGIYRLCHSTTSRYGYMQHAIYGVCHKFNDNGYPDHMYHIFIGECPHKDENGNWTTYNEVPNFLIGAFGGAHFISEEPDIPHIIDIQTDEFWYSSKKRRDDNEGSMRCEINKMREQIDYCSFRTYLKGLWNRTKLYLGKITLYKGENSKMLEYCLPKYAIRLSYIIDNDGSSKYIWLETEDWWRNIYFKRDGKRCLKFEKTENSHCYCSL